MFENTTGMRVGSISSTCEKTQVSTRVRATMWAETDSATGTDQLRWPPRGPASAAAMPRGGATGRATST
jgi:hypothetical protein